MVQMRILDSIPSFMINHLVAVLIPLLQDNVNLFMPVALLINGVSGLVDASSRPFTTALYRRCGEVLVLYIARVVAKLLIHPAQPNYHITLQFLLAVARERYALLQNEIHINLCISID